MNGGGEESTPPRSIRRVWRAKNMGSADEGDGGEVSTQHFYFLTLRICMVVAWKELTLEGLCPPQYSEGGGAPGIKKIFPRVTYAATTALSADCCISFTISSW